MTEQKGNTGLDLLPLMKEWDKNYYFRFIETDQSNFGLISTYVTMKIGSQSASCIPKKNPAS